MYDLGCNMCVYTCMRVQNDKLFFKLTSIFLLGTKNINYKIKDPPVVYSTESSPLASGNTVYPLRSHACATPAV